MNIIAKITRLISILLHGEQKTIANIIQLPPNELLKGKCAFISGGTSGIGLAIAKSFLEAGACVIITSRNKERMDNALKRLENKGKVLGVILDCTTPDTFPNILSKTLNQIHQQNIPHIDILVNNAGVNCPSMPNATEDDYDKVLDTNLKGTYFLSQLFGQYWKENHIKGNILNIASASSLRPANSPYTLSKWGLRGLTLGLAKALGPEGITVNGIAPGPTATPMMHKDSSDNIYLERLPLGRYITPEEIANMAVFLVSDMGRSIMGDMIYMTGGAGLLTYDDVEYSF